MAKKFGKFLLFSLFAGAAAAGTYYFLKNKEEEDAFEDSEPDVNDELEEFLKNESESDPIPAKREYVPLNFSKEEVEDAENAVDEEEAAEKEPVVQEAAPVKESAPAPAEKEEPLPESEEKEEAETAPEPAETPYVEKKLEEAAEKVSFEEENIIGKPVEESTGGVEKDPGPKNDRISTFSFSSFED